MRVLLALFAVITFSLANIGKVSVVVGDAKIQRDNSFIVVKSGVKLEEKDIIHTSKNAKVQLVFSDNTIITVGKNSALDIKEYLYDLKNPKNSKTDFHFFKGAFKTITGKIGKLNKKKFKLRTKNATIGIRGTIVLGNQDIIACTQGAITVEGAGVRIDVNANELTVIQSNNQPSKAKTMTSSDVQVLENIIEPESSSKQESEVTQEKEDANTSSKEETNQNSEEESDSNSSQSQNESVSNNEDANTNEPIIEEEIVLEDNSLDNLPPAIPTPEEFDSNDDDPVDPLQNGNSYLNNAKELTALVQNEELKVNNASTEVVTALNGIPSMDELNQKVSDSNTIVQNTQSSLDSAIIVLNDSTASSLINASKSNSLNTYTSESNTLKIQSSDFNTALNAQYNSSLTQAQNELMQAQQAYDDLETEALKIKTILSDAKQNNVEAVIIAEIELEEIKIDTALASAKVSIDLAQDQLDNIESTLTTTANQLSLDAQMAKNNSNIIQDLILLIDSMEALKQSSLDTQNSSSSTVSSKNLTQTASNSATSAASDLSALTMQVNTAKDAVIVATNDTQSASNTATHANTLNVQVGYSSKVAQDNAFIAQNNSQIAATKASQAELKLQDAKDYVEDMKTNLTNTSTAFTQTAQNLVKAQQDLNNAKNYELNVDASNTQAKQAAQAAVTKAQDLYNTALQAHNDAQTAYTEAQNIVNNLDESTFIANLEAQNTEAQNSASLALTNANSASTLAQSAKTAAKTASANVKTSMLNKTKVSLDESGNSIDNSTNVFELSGEKTNETVINKNFGGYTGSTQLGVFKANEDDVNALYNVQSDSLQEFFVSFSASSNPVNSLSVYGNNTITFDNSKIYVYKSFKMLETSGGSGTFSNETIISFYNPATNSFTSLSKDFYKEGANVFVAGNQSKVNVTKNHFDLGGDSYLDSVTTVTSSLGTNAIKGSQAQGNVQVITNDDLSQEIKASFLTDKQNQDSTITQSLTGKVLLVSNESGSTGNRVEDFTATITDNGANGVSISALAKYGNGNTIMAYSGNTKPDTLSAYYINSDIWGAKASSGNGFMMAVPDGAYDSNGKFSVYDENDNPLTSDDDSSWGYWTGVNSINSGSGSVNPRSTWVAGIETASSVVQGLINGSSQTLSFNGKVMGVVDFVNPIVMDDSNKVNLNFDVGGGSASMNGSVQFKSVNNHAFNLSINGLNTTVNASGFNGKFTGTNVDDSFNHFNGKFYGNGSVKSVGGSFNVRQDNHQAYGVFKATKQ